MCVCVCVGKFAVIKISVSSTVVVAVVLFAADDFSNGGQCLRVSSLCYSTRLHRTHSHTKTPASCVYGMYGMCVRLEHTSFGRHHLVNITNLLPKY